MRKELTQKFNLFIFKIYTIYSKILITLIQDGQFKKEWNEHKFVIEDHFS